MLPNLTKRVPRSLFFFAHPFTFPLSPSPSWLHSGLQFLQLNTLSTVSAASVLRCTFSSKLNVLWAHRGTQGHRRQSFELPAEWWMGMKLSRLHSPTPLRGWTRKSQPRPKCLAGEAAQEAWLVGWPHLLPVPLLTDAWGCLHLWSF